ncbi:MAG: glutathione peroxidase [Sphingobacteriales bacterium]|nr:MAG: glutathione peroxidase [Sphingobacteriales bacterium]
MKILTVLAALMLFTSTSSVYDFKLKNIDGKPFSLSKYKGKKVLIVNTASECGFTPQYAELQQLAEKYKNKLVVVGFPANNFGGQEPGANLEIKSFCQKNYGVTFPLNEKVSVKGDDIHPLFKFLTAEPNPDFTGEIKWNFEKFLVDEHGKLIHRYRSNVKPLSEELTKSI